jgi:hypothetical protein
MSLPKVTAEAVISAIRIKHGDCIVVEQCKSGPTWNSDFSQLDVWVMPKTWANFTTIGYEVKVSRSDFVNDKKWQKYLPMCHEMNFAAPKGLISVDELPKEVGLLELVGTQRLITRRKAVKRDIVVHTDTLLYILMWRAQIDRKERSGVSDIQAYLDGKKELYYLGGRFHKKVRAEMAAVQEENRNLQNRISSYQEIERIIDQLGLSRDIRSWDFKRKLESLNLIFPKDLKWRIDSLARELTNVSQELQGLEGDQRAVI